jgi:alkylation response protein AidB-like acyl-CoA dehydrogenase
VRQLLVPTSASGLRIEPQQSIDLVKQYARVCFDGVHVEASAVVGSAAETAGLIDRQSHIAQVLQCAEVVGILQTVFDFTVGWALNRHTFGRPLASYQALKHRFADMKMWLEACRATTAAAVAAIAARCADAGLSASIAKSYVGEMAPEIVQGCIQMHGGIGVTWEHDLHLYLRRVALYRSMFGTPEEHNLRVYEWHETGQPAPRTA